MNFPRSVGALRKGAARAGSTALLGSLLLAALAGCGQKGPLSLPKEASKAAGQTQRTAVPAAPAASEPASASR